MTILTMKRMKRLQDGRVWYASQNYTDFYCQVEIALMQLWNRFYDAEKYILHNRMISNIFLGMLLSKTRANIEEYVNNNSGKLTSFPKK